MAVPTLTGTDLGATQSEAPGNPSPDPAPVLPANAFHANDTDGEDLIGAQVRISAGFLSGAGHQDILTINGTQSGTAGSINWSYDSGTGVMLLTGPGTFAEYEALLDSVGFLATGDNPTDYGADGTRTIAYSVADGANSSTEVLATVTVNGANDAPVSGGDDSATGNEDATTIAGTVPAASDVDSSGLIYSLVSGTVKINGVPADDSTVSFDPSGNYSYTTGADDQALHDSEPRVITFDYVANDGTAVSTQATVTITVNGANDPPVASDDTVAVNEDATATAANRADGLLGNDTDIDSGETASLVVQGAHFGTDSDTAVTSATVIHGTYGDLTVSADGTYTYTPSNDPAAQALAKDAPASDVFSYTIADVNGATSTATITFNITGQNDAPVALANSVTTDEDIASSPVPIGATDVDGDTLTYTVDATGLPTKGAVTFDQGAGTFTYTPTLNQNGSDTFIIDIDDGTAITQQTVTVTINAVNDAPVFTNLDGAGTPAFLEDSSAVVLDSNATIVDVELAAAGNYAGATLTLARSTGAVAEDVFGTSGTLAFSAPGNGTVTVGGTPVGTFTQSGGTLVITFNSGATQSLVNTTLQDLTYSNTSQNPPTSAVIAYAFDDGNVGAQGTGGPLPGNGTVTVSITPVDDDPVAVADAPNVQENAAFAIAVVGNDTDVDGGPKNVVSVNGTTLSAGQSVNLGSGAKVTLNNDGTLSYDPNHVYDQLTSTAGGETGAVNTQASDSFDYALNGGSSTTVSVTINGVANAADHLNGNSGNNVITGTIAGDFFDLSQGGNDTATGLGGNDAFYFGAAFTAADKVDGGAGTNDQLGLQGNYTGGNKVIMAADSFVNVEVLVVLAGVGFNYDITTNDANVASGGLLKVHATQLASGQSLTFNGAAETDGAFLIFGGQGNDNLTGGQKDDAFYFGPNAYSAADVVNGGPGNNDQLGLDGNYGAFGPAFTLGVNITNVETIVLLPGPAGSPNSFNITTSDVLVPGGQTMTIYGLQVATDITFDGSHELNGAFRIFGGSGNDILTGSSGNDFIFGGGGGDRLTGGPGSDNFYYDDASQSTSVNYDRIIGFDKSVDTIDLPFAVTGSLASSSGALSTNMFDVQLGAAFAGLASHQAGLFTATSGDLAGHTFLVIDADGNAGYQAGSDYVIEMVTPVTPIDNAAIFV